MTRPRYRSKRPEDMEESSKGSLSPSTCIAHLILAGTSAWTFKHCKTEWPFSYSSYILIFGHSIIGAAYYGHPQPNDTFRKICRNSAAIIESCPIPFLTTELLLLKGGDSASQLCYIPAVTALFPFIGSFFMDEDNHMITDINVGLNLCVLLYFAIQNDSPWAYGLVTLGVLNQFIFSQICERYEVPRMDLVAIGLTFFCIFSISTIYESI